MNTVAHRLDSFQEYFFSKANTLIQEVEQHSGEKVINLGIGSPDLPPQASVIERLKTESDDPLNHRYPTYNGDISLRTAIAHYYKKRFNVTLDVETEILPLIGSKEGLVHACFAFLNPGESALVPNPGYPAYTAGPLLADGKVQHYNLKESNGWKPDFDEIAAMDLSRTKIWWIGYPNNPTGAVATKDEMSQWITFALERDLLIFYDNPYAEIYFDKEKPHSILEIDGAKTCAIEFNSLSKSHNLAGWRVGMVMGGADHIRAIQKVKSNIDTGIFLPIQKAAAFALESTTREWMEERNAIYMARRDSLCTVLQDLGFTCHVPKASLYVWAHAPISGRPVEKISFDLIKECQVFLTPGTAFGKQGEGYFRISLCQSTENIETAGERLASFFEYFYAERKGVY